MAFEDRLKEARKQADLTQEQAASQIGVAKSTWAGYERGNSQPDIAKTVKIMEVLRIDANFLWQDYMAECKPAQPQLSPAAYDIAVRFDRMGERGKAVVRTVVDYIGQEEITAPAPLNANHKKADVQDWI